MWPTWISDVADDKLFQALAGFASILALLITFRVYWLAAQISQRISARLRLPALRNGLANDLAELNRLNFSRASPDLIVACLATCRSRVRAVRRYRSDVRARRWIQVETSMARVLAFFGADAPVRQLSYAIYGQLVEMVADLDDFLARRPFEE